MAGRAPFETGDLELSVCSALIMLLGKKEGIKDGWMAATLSTLIKRSESKATDYLCDYLCFVPVKADDSLVDREC